MLKRLRPEIQERLLAEAGSSHMAGDGIAYPHWYLHRWHFLPEGYLSRRSVAAYDVAIRRLYYQLQERRVLERLASHLQGAANVLELACGPGRALALLRRRLPSAKLTGVDLSPFMLERAAARVPFDVELVHASSASLPWEPGRFDTVVALHHLGHQPLRAAAKALREAERVLAPGGRLALVEHSWHRLPDSRLEPLHEERLAAGLMRLTVWAKPQRPA
ncbi:MAG: class I SAM-dependent methyltransferase [Hyphomicrobiales bacterium]